MYCLILIIFVSMFSNSAKHYGDAKTNHEKEHFPLLHMHDVSPLVHEFMKVLLDTLDAENPVDVVFGPAVSSPSFADVMYDVVNIHGEEIGVEKHEDVAEEIEDAFTDAYNSLTPVSLIGMIGQCVGLFLYSENILNEDNVAELANGYATSILKALNSSPVSTVHALGDGLQLFLGPKKLFTPEKWDILKAHFVKAIYLVSKTNL